MPDRHAESEFCRGLAAWLVTVPWRYTTLITCCINVIDQPPAQVDRVIHALLCSFRSKPAVHHIDTFLRDASQAQEWFRPPVRRPRIVTYCLTPPPTMSVQIDSDVRLDNAHDMAQWLNVTDGQLYWLADLRRHAHTESTHFNHYVYSSIKKRDGGRRLIESPKSTLKSTQRTIYRSLKASIDVHDAAHGYRPQRSYITHAAMHINNNHVFRFDLSNCFQSITWRQVNGVFRALGCSGEIARLLTGLTTHRCYSEHTLIREMTSVQRQLLHQRHLPQGAPTSPVLANGVLRKLDVRLHGLATSLDLTYSRYADDLVFSTSTDRDWRFLETRVGSICLDEGFELNYRKTRHMRRHQRQRVTGIIVNDVLNIDRRDYDRLKATLTNCIRHGLESQNRDGHNTFRAHLWGRVQQVKSVNKPKGCKLEALFHKIGHSEPNQTH